MLSYYPRGAGYPDLRQFLDVAWETVNHKNIAPDERYPQSIMFRWVL